MSAADRFWSKVDKTGACWLWTGGKTAAGYGGAWVEGSFVYAHRLAYELTSGSPIAPGLMVDHICHVRSCVRPEHLRLATNKQNLENLATPYSTNRSSGVRGVSWHRKTRKWRVQVCHQRRSVYGGLFVELADAEQAAMALRNRLFTFNDADRGAPK